MYTGSLIELYAGDNPLGFWKPSQVWGSNMDGMGFPLLGREARGGGGLVDILAIL